MPKIKVNPDPPGVFAPPELVFGQSRLGQQLRDLLNNHAATPGNRAIADFLLRNPVRAVAWGIEELAANAGTSTATLSRFARVLGMNGFAALRAEMAAVLQGVLQPVEKLRGAVGQGGDHHQAVAGCVEASLANAQAAAQGLDGPLLADCAARLVQASGVYTLGFGLSAHLAAILALDLQPYYPGLINVVEFGGTEVAAGRLMNIGPGDVLVAISLPRYADDALRLTGYARSRGATVIAITDSLASPLASLADHVLLAPAQHPVLPSGTVAALLVIEALVSAVVLSTTGQVEKAGRLTEAISHYLYTPRPS